jgi:hypothetical protein
VWVIDKNKTVYVYGGDGNPQGSWTAGGLRTPEGIATDGTNIWIVDARQKQIFYYEDAALTAVDRSATSSFALDGSNTKAKGITTDGSFIWVVNDNKVDTVFKYNLAGTLLGSWIIDSANAKPTGITIDPSGGSNIWIVDSGKDQVFQYTDAATLIDGSQDADALLSFNLDVAAGNTNPQGIADPPPQLSQTVTSTVPAVSFDSWPTLPSFNRGELAFPTNPTKPVTAQNAPTAGAVDKVFGRGRPITYPLASALDELSRPAGNRARAGIGPLDPILDDLALGLLQRPEVGRSKSTART